LRVTLAVDAITPALTGIGRYTWELARRLRNAPAIKDAQFFRAGQWIDDPDSLLSESAAPSVRRLRGPQWLQQLQTGRLNHNRLFHGPNYFLPPHVEAGVITIHDLSTFVHPETHPIERLRDFERQFDSSLKRAVHILTDTRTTRDEVIAFTGWAPEQVTAVHLGVSSAFKPVEAEILSPILEAYGLTPGGYGLCVATLEPRKRVGELVRAWRALPTEARSRWPLVVVGGAGWLSEGIQTSIADGAAEGWVKYLGYVPERDLPQIYAGAALFVYASTYEGFGLPPLEAMACGVPVVVSNRSCLPEVTQGAALMVDPDDAESFTLALERGLTDGAWRSGAIVRGLTVAGSYSWDRCAATTIDVYRSVVKR